MTTHKIHLSEADARAFEDHREYRQMLLDGCKAASKVLGGALIEIVDQNGVVMGTSQDQAH